MNVEACVGGGDCVLKSVPIRHHETFETPIPAEDVGEEKLVGALWKAVEPRVCAHHSAGPAVPNRNFKRQQLRLARGRFVYFHIRRFPLTLPAVDGEMLHCREDVF